MKRVLLSIIGTVIGLVSLLSYKTHPLGPDAASLPLATPGSPHTSTPHGHRQPPSSGRTAHQGKPSQQTVQGAAVNTRYGVVQVSVTLAGKKIEQVRIDRMDAPDAHSAQIHQYATPVLVKETMAAQSAKIDTVSGATYTSQGYTQSLQSALDQAGA
jgi:uncharacterized protein with FMN-binding domain